MTAPCRGEDVRNGNSNFGQEKIASIKAALENLVWFEKRHVRGVYILALASWEHELSTGVGGAARWRLAPGRRQIDQVPHVAAPP